MILKHDTGNILHVLILLHSFPSPLLFSLYFTNHADFLSQAGIEFSMGLLSNAGRLMCVGRHLIQPVQNKENTKQSITTDASVCSVCLLVSKAPV